MLLFSWMWASVGFKLLFQITILSMQQLWCFHFFRGFLLFPGVDMLSSFWFIHGDHVCWQKSTYIPWLVIDILLTLCDAENGYIFVLKQRKSCLPFSFSRNKRYESTESIFNNQQTKFASIISLDMLLMVLERSPLRQCREPNLGKYSLASASLRTAVN